MVTVVTYAWIFLFHPVGTPGDETSVNCVSIHRRLIPGLPSHTVMKLLARTESSEVQVLRVIITIDVSRSAFVLLHPGAAPSWRDDVFR